jgi:hypothetical protein
LLWNSWQGLFQTQKTNIRNNTILEIVYLGKRKICAKFVPCTLTVKQKEHRVKDYEYFMATWF